MKLIDKFLCKIGLHRKIYYIPMNVGVNCFCKSCGKLLTKEDILF